MKRIRIFAALVAGLPVVAGPAWAELPAMPDLAALPRAQASQALAGPEVGRLALATAPVLLRRADAAEVVEADWGTALGAGDVLQVPADGQARVELAGGDVIHVLGPAVLALETGGGAAGVDLWQGRVAVYRVPRLEGQAEPMEIRTGPGALAVAAGHLVLEAAGPQQVAIDVFENRALWRPDGGADAQLLAAGQRAAVSATGMDIASPDPSARQAIVSAISPERPLVERAVAAYAEQRFDEAKRLFTALQASFPYNRGAAYYLGQIALEEGRRAVTIEQWQRFERIDPPAAQERDIPRHLTVLIAQEMKAQLQQALVDEQYLSRNPPEPNSVAVAPFDNRGEPQFDSLSKGLAALIISDLAKVPGMKVLERQKIHKLIDEIKLSQSGLVEEETAVRAGRILRSENLVIGDFKIENAEGLTQ